VSRNVELNNENVRILAQLERSKEDLQRMKKHKREMQERLANWQAQYRALETIKAADAGEEAKLKPKAKAKPAHASSRGPASKVAARSSASANTNTNIRGKTTKKFTPPSPPPREHLKFNATVVAMSPPTASSRSSKKRGKLNLGKKGAQTGAIRTRYSAAQVLPEGRDKGTSDATISTPISATNSGVAVVEGDVTVTTPVSRHLRSPKSDDDGTTETAPTFDSKFRAPDPSKNRGGSNQRSTGNQFKSRSKLSVRSRRRAAPAADDDDDSQLATGSSSPPLKKRSKKRRKTGSMTPSRVGIGGEGVSNASQNRVGNDGDDGDDDGNESHDMNDGSGAPVRQSLQFLDSSPSRDSGRGRNASGGGPPRSRESSPSRLHHPTDGVTDANPTNAVANANPRGAGVGDGQRRPVGTHYAELAKFAGYDEEETAPLESESESQSMPPDSAKAGPAFAYKEVVRNKEDRKKMMALSCDDCHAWFQSTARSNGVSMESLLQGTSKHRCTHKPPTELPEFWECGFPNTQDDPQQASIRLTGKGNVGIGKQHQGAGKRSALGDLPNDANGSSASALGPSAPGRKQTVSSDEFSSEDPTVQETKKKKLPSGWMCTTKIFPDAVDGRERPRRTASTEEQTFNTL
jgi:hypothetical protein